MRLIIDMDEVIVDFLNPLIKEYNKRHNKNLTLQDITDWKLPPGMTEIFTEKGFFLELPPMPGAIDSITALQDEGHDIIVASKTSRTPYIASDKLAWMMIWLPRLVDDLYLVERKDRISGDLIIDDAVANLKTSPAPYKLKMVRPYNQWYPYAVPVNNWHEIMIAVKAYSLGCRLKYDVPC